MTISEISSLPVLVCDLDGTLILEDLERSFLEFLVRTGSLHHSAVFLSSVLTPLNFILKRFELGSAWKVWLAGLSRQRRDELFTKFLSSWKWSVSEPVLNCVRAFSGRKILLTGSFEALVNQWIDVAGMRSVFDEVIGCRVFDGSIRVERHPYGRSKIACLRALKPAVALGNEYADRHLLSMSQTAICVGGDARLVAALKNHRHRIGL